MILARPELLLLLLLLPLALAVRWWQQRRGHGNVPTLVLANFTSARKARPSLKTRLRLLPDVLRWAGIATLVVALARPQTEDIEVLLSDGLDIMVCLDMSGSMASVDRTAEDIMAEQMAGREPPNRFQVAVSALKDFVKNRQGDRLGLVVFASDAYLKFPLTLDYATVLEQLDGLVLDSSERERGRDGCINNCTINGERTAIGDALIKANKRIENGEGKGKIIVLITDGNDNASSIDPMTVARYIGDQPDGSRPRLYTFMIGSGKNTHVPAVSDGRVLRRFGAVQYAPSREPVDETRIREMVDAARGVFSATYDEEQFRQAFEGLERSQREETRLARHQDLFPYFVLVGLLILSLEFVLRHTWFRRYP